MQKPENALDQITSHFVCKRRKSYDEQMKQNHDIRKIEAPFF